jgi:hypothetical protein
MRRPLQALSVPILSDEEPARVFRHDSGGVRVSAGLPNIWNITFLESDEAVHTALRPYFALASAAAFYVRGPPSALSCHGS